MIVVAKFGGSSLANAEQFSKVKNIVMADEHRRVVVVSAMGKVKKSDSKITDLLYLTSAHIKYGFDYNSVLQKVFDRYNLVKTQLNLTVDLNKEFDIIRANLKSSFNEEYLVSRGEYLSALLMAEYIGYDFVDSTKLIFFNYDGSIDEQKTNNAISQEYQNHNKMVVPGFYGVYPSGAIKLFSRGGSDITGSLMAKGLTAIKYENWTDVSGIYMADPKLIDNPKRISEVTYDELRELSYMGASVLHEETIFPIQDLNIPICILNTNHPDEKGTIICQQAKDNSQIITGIAGKKNFKSFTIVKKRSANKLSVIKDVLEMFERYHLTIEHIPTSIDSFSIVVESKLVEKCTYDLIGEIKRHPDIIDIIIDDDIALLAVVGRNMATRVGIAGSIFSVFGENGINIKMIAQGSQEINIIIGVSNRDFEKSVRAIYFSTIK